MLSAFKVKPKLYSSTLKTACNGPVAMTMIHHGCIMGYIMMLWCVLMLNLQFEEQEEEVILSGLYWKIINFQRISCEP